MNATTQMPSLLTPAFAPIADYRQHLTDFHQWLADQFNAGQSVNRLVQMRSDDMDRLLTQLWHKFDLHTYPGLALVAVGGYGRQELHPRSDIDLLVCSHDPLSPDEEEQISAFITFLWDLRLDVGHSVRTIDECLARGREDLTIATNLIESRLICGATLTFSELQAQLTPDRFWPSEEFFCAKRQEQKERHRQFRGTAYKLEPDLKSNPGGLRDIQTLTWVARRHFGSQNLSEMVRHHFLTQAEYRELQECLDFLWRVRFALHLETRRGDNRLLFDRQLSVAQTLGYHGEGNKAVEQMMKRFYQTIRRVAELNEMLLQLFDEAILGNTDINIVAIDTDFQLRGTLIDAISPELFLRRPDKMLQLFLHVAHNSNITGIHSATLRQLREARRNVVCWLQDIPACRDLMVTLLQHPQSMALPITLMHKHGVLATYLPEWSRIVGQMQFDLFHAYTVDEHTHRLLKIIHSYQFDAAKETHPLCHSIFTNQERPVLLYLAAIFHDIGKGRSGDHSLIGAKDARAFCELHGFSRADSKLVARLVRYHLLMSVTAQRRDIHDPDVVAEFARQIRDEQHLDLLYCLTVADICATNDDAWNSWKGSLLRELYYSTQRAFRRGLENPLDARDRIKENKIAASQLLRAKGFHQTDIDALWGRFRPDYFLRHNAAQLRWHTEHILPHRNKETPLVLVSKRASRGGNEIFIYSKDQASLFATVATALDQKNLNIHSAQLMSSRDGYVLDTFVALEPDGSPINPNRIHTIRDSLEKALANPGRLKMRNRRMSRQMRQFNVPTQVNFLPNRRKRAVMEIVALDTPGLLARISRTFQALELHIHTAKITTIGERAEDFFILSDKNKHPLSAEQQAQLREKLIKELNPEQDL